MGRIRPGTSADIDAASGIDHKIELGGLWPSGWACECGGPRRQKAAPGGLGIAAGETLAAVTRTTGEWNVMFVRWSLTPK